MSKFVYWQGDTPVYTSDKNSDILFAHIDKVTEEIAAEEIDGVVVIGVEAIAEAHYARDSALVRGLRDKRLKEHLWPLERHQQEKTLGLQTTLTDEQYQSALLDVQYLRDLPTQEGFPWGGVEEAAPWQRPEGWRPVRVPIPEVKEKI